MKKLILFFVACIGVLSADSQNFIGFPDSVRGVEINPETGAYRFERVKGNWQKSDFKAQEKAMWYQSLFKDAKANPDSLIVAGFYEKFIGMVSFFKAKKEYQDYGIVYNSVDSTMYFKKSEPRVEHGNSLLLLPAIFSVFLMLIINVLEKVSLGYKKEIYYALKKDGEEVGSESEESEAFRDKFKQAVNELRLLINLIFYSSILEVALLVTFVTLTALYIEPLLFPLIISIAALYFAAVYLFVPGKLVNLFFYYLLMTVYFVVILC
jgi:hypothetical protein